MSSLLLRTAALAALLFTGSALWAEPAAPDALVPSSWRPSGLFVQAGAAEGASALVGGALWDWGWSRQLAMGAATGYWELSLGRWQSRSGDDAHAWVTQFGVTPVLRLQPSRWGDWFWEAGVGVNLLAPIYRTRDKRFSTVLNFGSHLAVGRRFGASAEQELALRIQHFSNGGIHRPNPGEEFVQLRYSHRF